MPTICTSCRAKTDDVGKLTLRMGTCASCKDRLEREHAKLRAIASFYDPSAATVLGIDLKVAGE